MSEKNLKRILLAVGVVVVVYVVAALFRGGLESGNPSAATELSQVLSSLDPDDVEDVTLINQGDTIHLARSGERWTVNGFRADSGRVARFWESLTDTDGGTVVARNPENHDRLGVEGEDAERVVLRTAGGETHELILGNSGPTYPSVYVRLAGADPVHLLEGSLAVSARQSLTTWRDHTIARMDTSRVRSVELATPDGGYTLSRTDGEWTVDGEAAASTPARNLVGGLSRVMASEFPDSSRVSEEESSERRTLVALGSGGDTLVNLTVLGSQGSGYTARAAGDSVTYEIAAFDVARLFPDRSSLLADAGDGTSGDDGPGGDGGPASGGTGP